MAEGRGGTQEEEERPVGDIGIQIRNTLRLKWRQNGQGR